MIINNLNIAFKANTTSKKPVVNPKTLNNNNIDQFVSFKGNSPDTIQKVTDKDFVEQKVTEQDLDEMKTVSKFFQENPDNLKAKMNSDQKTIAIYEKFFLYTEQNIDIAKKYFGNETISVSNLKEIAIMTLLYNFKDYIVNLALDTHKNGTEEDKNLFKSTLKSQAVNTDCDILTKMSNLINEQLNKSPDPWLKELKETIDTTINQITSPVKFDDINNIKDEYLILLRKKLKYTFANASKDYINSNTDNFINLIKDLYKDNQIDGYCLIDSIKLMYPNLDDKGKMDLEDTVLNILKTTKEKDIINIGTNFFFNDDEHKDKDFQKLTEIVKKLNSFDPQEGPEYIKTREELFNQELLITAQEVMESEKYLDRAVKMNVFHDGFPKNDEEALLTLKTKALYALCRVLYTENDLNIKPDVKLCEQLSDNIINNLKEMKNYNQNEKLIINSIDFLSWTYKLMNAETQNKMQDCVYKICNQSDNKNVKNRALSFIQKYSQNNKLPEREKYKEIKTLLTDNNALPEQKRTAVWEAGVNQNSTNFKLLCDLVNPDKLVNLDNLTSDELELKELALRSIAEYGDKKAVRFLEKIIDSINILNKQKNKTVELKQSLSGMSELAEALLDNINAKKSTQEVITKAGYPQKVIDKNNYYQKDFYIKKHLDHLNNSHDYLREKCAYESLRNKFIPDFKALSPDLQNYIDNVLLPFRPLLKQTVSNNNKVYIIDDTVTSIAKEFRGVRNYTDSYEDNAGGINFNDNVVIPCRSATGSDVIAGTIGHEWGHSIHHNIMRTQPELAQKIENLYNQALKQDNFLDYYSKTNVEEYFAQANEAYLSIYKPHYYFAAKDDYNNSNSNTRSKLKRKDPEMFKLLDELYKQSSKANLTKQVNLVA